LDAFNTLDMGIKHAKDNYRNFIRYAEFYFEQGNINMTLNYISVAYNVDAAGTFELLSGISFLMENEDVQAFIKEKNKK
jgi:hypothetical protein